MSKKQELTNLQNPKKGEEEKQQLQFKKTNRLLRDVKVNRLTIWSK